MILLLIFTSMAVATAALTYYGQQVGNFVVGINDEARDQGLVLATDPNFEKESAILVGESITNVDCIALGKFYPSDIRNTNGSYISSGGNCMGFTFYVKNVGTEAVNVDVTMSYDRVTHYADEAAWVWIFEDEEDDEGTIYHKQDYYDGTYPASYNRYNIKEFAADNVVMTSQIIKLKYNEVKKYTVIIWIDGNDPDAIDTTSRSILGGRIKFSMTFEIAETVVTK